MFIKNLNDIKLVINKNLKGTVYRVVNRETLNGVGFEKFIGNYVILSINKSPESKLIKKDVDIFCLENFLNKPLLQKSKEANDIFSNSSTINYLNKKKYNKYFLTYKISKNLREYCKKKKENKILNISDNLRNKLENKILFNFILKQSKIREIPNTVIYLKNEDQIFAAMRKFKKIVIQVPDSFAGFGTEIVENKIDVKRVCKNLRGKKIRITKFIEGPLLSCTGCITEFGVLISPIRYQIIGDCSITESNHAWCGNDWNVNNLSNRTKDKAYIIVKKIGKYLSNEYNYKGIFGIDFVFDNKEKILYPLELNPRLLGTTQMYISMQVEDKEPPFLGFHILEFLGAEYSIDINKLNAKIKKEKKGAHIILRNKFQDSIIVKKTLRPGVYKYKNKKLIFIRSGYCLQHIEDKKNEFVITAIPMKGKVFEKGSQVIRVHTYNKVLDENNRFLNNKFKLICIKIYDTIIN